MLHMDFLWKWLVIMNWDWTNKILKVIWFQLWNDLYQEQWERRAVLCLIFLFWFFYFFSLPLFLLPFLKVVHPNSWHRRKVWSLKVTLQKNHQLSLGPNKWMAKKLWYYHQYGSAQYHFADNSSEFGKFWAHLLCYMRSCLWNSNPSLVWYIYQISFCIIFPLSLGYYSKCTEHLAFIYYTLYIISGEIFLYLNRKIYFTIIYTITIYV